MAPPVPRLHRPAGIRLLLPGALRARQARPARSPAVRRASSPRSSRSQRRASRASRGSSRCATTGAPADDRGRAAQQALRRPARALPPRAARRRGRERDLLPGRTRRAARLPRPERRRQVDHDQDAHRHPRSLVGPRVGGRSRSFAAARRARPEDRRHVRPACPALVGPAAAGFVRPAAPHLQGPGRPLSREPRPLPRGARPRSLPADAGPPALARAAHPRRADRGDAARSRAALPRRADHRARRRRQAARPRLPRRDQPGRGRHRAADDPRPRRHRAALQPAPRHRPRPADLGRAHRRPEGALRSRAHADRRPRGAGAAARARRGARREGRRPTAVAALSRLRRRADRAGRRDDAARRPADRRARHRGDRPPDLLGQLEPGTWFRRSRNQIPVRGACGRQQPGSACGRTIQVDM